MAYSVLLVDDESNVIEALKRALHKEPYKIFSAGSADEAIEILARQSVDVVVSDEMMPGMRGSELLALVNNKYPETVRIMLTGHANLDSALRAINEGQIYRYLQKPCNELELKLTIRQAIQRKELACKSRRLLQKVRHQDSILKQLEGEHPGITRVERDPSGTIVLAEDYNLDELIEQMQAELEEFETFTPGSKGG